MEINIKEKIGKFINSDKKIKILVAVGLVSVLLIFLSEAIPKDTTSKAENNQTIASYTEYAENLENKTESVITSIDGAGKCKVMIMLKNTNEGVYAKNINESADESSNSSSYEYVLYNGDNGEEPILIKEYFPEIQGVVVVCQGADNTVVKENVINTISSLYGIPTSKIYVSKLKG